MRAHFRHLRFKSFPIVQKKIQSNEFWPLKLLYEDLGLHQNSIGTPIPKMRTQLGVYGLIPSHSPTFMWAWNVTPELHFWFAPLQALALVTSPRLGSRQKWVICVLYFITYWNILAIFLSSSKFASSACTDPNVWNLGVCPLKLIFEEPKLMCEIYIFPKIFVRVVKLGFESNISSLFCGTKTNCCTFGNSSSRSCICSIISCWAWIMVPS